MTDDEVMRDLQFLTGSRHRGSILAELCEESLRPSALCDRVDATRTTVQRILAGFRERAWVEKVDGEYRATMTGRRIEQQYRSLRATAERADQFAPLARHLEPFDEPLPPAAFEDGTLTAATDGNSLAAVDRLVEWLEASDGSHVQTTTPIVADTFNETVAGLLSDGLTVDMVIDENVLERSASQFQTALQRGQNHEGVTVSVVSEPLNDGLMVRDGGAGVVAYDETNNVRAILESEDASVEAWARDRFEATKARARPLAAVLSDDPVEPS